MRSQKVNDASAYLNLRQVQGVPVKTGKPFTRHMHGNSVQMNRLVESYEIGIRNEDDSRELTEVGCQSDGFTQFLIDIGQACYVYSPNNGTREYDERPKKRRKRSHLEQNPKPSGTSIFIPLLGGAEKLVYAELRESTYNTAWVDQEIIFEVNRLL